MATYAFGFSKKMTIQRFAGAVALLTSLSSFAFTGASTGQPVSVAAPVAGAVTNALSQESSEKLSETKDQWMWWKPVGSASLTWGFWKIYDSELRTPSGVYNADSPLPLALVITYDRDIDADDLLDATVEQWEHLGFSADIIASWKPQMKNAWPDVKEGDRLIYVLDRKDGAFFYQPKQGQLTAYAALTNMPLATAFADIWLSPKTAYPSLRLALIGGK
ncbi:hypothetical protein [Enterovibrio sp. 27052020O]|uniref:hypothetical protein n=1 Tax=Enterovibrio sp. 27052020O TaxID=3241166 RepID=UPI00388DE767